MNLGNKIKEFRNKQELTQNELADKLFVSFQAVSQWENGTTNPDINTLIKLAKTFNISLDELFDIKINKKHEKEEVEINIKDAKADELYILLAKGNQLQKLINYKEFVKHNDKIEVNYDGSINNIYTHFSITVKGDVNASAIAGDSVTCGNVGNDVHAGDSVTCGNICGNVTAGDSVTCGNIDGNVKAGDNVTCNEIFGGVKADTVNISNFR